jgi:AcrR family transcriptional regulator
MDNKRVSQYERILSAAYELIVTRGYANVSIRDVADKAEVVLSQVNYYFRNKEGLFTEVFKTMIEKYLFEVETILKKGETKKEKLNLLIHYFKNLLINSPELLRIFYDFASMSIWSENFGRLADELFSRLSEIIRVNIVDSFNPVGNKSSLSSEGISRMLLGTILGILLQFLNKPDYVLLDDSIDSLQLLYLSM